MAQPYVGEIRMFAGNFPPAGWMFCDGALLAISENETLFQLIGTTYGGDGESTFQLPNLQSRIPMHMGTPPGGPTYVLAEMAGTEQETLSIQQIPNHTHPLIASLATGQSPQCTDAILAQSSVLQPYRNGDGEIALAPASVLPVGGSQPHDNMHPYLCVNFIISLFGIFPSPT